MIEIRVSSNSPKFPPPAYLKTGFPELFSALALYNPYKIVLVIGQIHTISGQSRTESVEMILDTHLMQLSCRANDCCAKFSVSFIICDKYFNVQGVHG